MRLHKLCNFNALLETKIPKTFIVRLKHKLIYKMDKAYLRHQYEADNFQLTFKYENADLKVNREFNFCRQLSENIATFTTRAAANIEKAVNKKHKKRKSSTETEANEPVKVKILLNDTELTGDEICKDVFDVKSGKSVSLQVFDKKYEVLINSPYVDALTLPKSILANFLVYPFKFESIYTVKCKSSFIWYKSKDLKAWTQVGDDFLYSPTNEDVSCYLKLVCVPRNDRLEGPAAETVSEVPVDASPGLCPFELRHNFTKTRLSGDEFRVMSYNILADLYCDSDFTRTELHPYCPPYALAIDYRKQLFIKEIIGYNADIICLQEVDRKIYNYDLKLTLSHLGYDSDYALKGAEVAEGLACFYNNSRFKHLENHRVVLSEVITTDPLYSDIWESIQTNQKLSERILARSTVLQVNVLEYLGKNRIVVVANTHLYFHPDADHIRLLQGAICIRFVENLIESLKKKYENNTSLIFCGDFNSVPECGIYKLFTTGSVPHDFIDYKSNAEEAIENVHLKQSLQIGSACGTPKYTNFTAGFADCLDYIFYDKSNLAVSKVIPLPTLEELNQNTALPSVVFPSDHISLVADLKLL